MVAEEGAALLAQVFLLPVVLEGSRRLEGLTTIKTQVRQWDLGTVLVLHTGMKMKIIGWSPMYLREMFLFTIKYHTFRKSGIMSFKMQVTGSKWVRETNFRVKMA